jgi:hypothetical protein
VAEKLCPSSLIRTDGAPNANAERPEPIPYRSETGQHADRDDRNELSSWLVAGIVPGVERQPLKKLAIDESSLLKLLNRGREEAEKAGR